MAFEKQKYVSAKIEEVLVSSSPMIGFAQREFTGDVMAGSVIVSVYDSAISIGDYVEGVDMTTQNMDGSNKTLTIDVQKYFNFKVEDIEKVQAGNDINVWAEQAGKQVKGLIETSLWNLRTKASQSDLTAEAAVSVDNIVEYIENARVELVDKGNEGELVLYVNTYLSSLLNRAGLLADTSAYDGTYGPKKVKRFGDDIIVVSTSRAQASVGTNVEFLLATNDFLNIAISIEKVEAFRPEKSFSDAIKGLIVYGVEVYNTEKGINVTAIK